MVAALQTQELIDLLANETMPLVLLVDFNSSPSDTIDSNTGIVPPYTQLGWAGYLDAWLQGEDLSNPVSQMNERIDYIFYRSDVTALGNDTEIEIKTVGDKAKDKTPSGLWPSDHAGVTAEMEFAVQKHKNFGH